MRAMRPHVAHSASVGKQESPLASPPSQCGRKEPAQDLAHYAGLVRGERDARMSNLHLHKFKVERVAIRGMSICYRVTTDEGQVTLPTCIWHSVFETMQADSEGQVVAWGPKLVPGKEDA